MNTTTDLQVTKSTQPAQSTGARRRFSSRIVGLLAAFLMVTAGLFSTATPNQAEAATRYGYLYTCFRFLYGGGSGAWAYNTIAQANVNGAYYNIGTFRPPTNGRCLSYPMPSGYYWRFKVSTRPYGSSGPLCTMTSRSVYVKANRTYYMGTLWVICK